MRYLLIDMDKIRSGECNINNPDNLIGLNLDLAILSEEESLAKFKEIFMAGENFICWEERLTYSKKSPNWEQFKENL